MSWDLIGVAVAGGVIGLDRLSFGQFMISQPIVAAPLIGWLLGDIHTGLMIGAVLELFWLRGLPMGGHVPKDATLAAVLTTALSLLLRPSGSVEVAWIAWVFLWVAILLAPAGLLDQWIRKKNAWLIQAATSAPTLERGISRSVRVGMATFFLFYFGVTLVVLGASGMVLERGFALLSKEMLQGLRFFFFLLPAIGLASLLSRKDLKRGRGYLIAGGAASFLLFVELRLLHGAVLAALFSVALVMVIIRERRRAFL